MWWISYRQTVRFLFLIIFQIHIWKVIWKAYWVKSEGFVKNQVFAVGIFMSDSKILVFEDADEFLKVISKLQKAYDDSEEN